MLPGDQTIKDRHILQRKLLDAAETDGPMANVRPAKTIKVDFIFWAFRVSTV